MNRRDFLRKTGTAAGALAISGTLLAAPPASAQPVVKAGGPSNDTFAPVFFTAGTSVIVRNVEVRYFSEGRNRAEGKLYPLSSGWRYRVVGYRFDPDTEMTRAGPNATWWRNCSTADEAVALAKQDLLEPFDVYGVFQRNADKHLYLLASATTARAEMRARRGTEDLSRCYIRTVHIVPDQSIVYGGVYQRLADDDHGIYGKGLPS